MKKLFAVLLAVLLLTVSAVCVSADTPELPENNRLLSDSWFKLLGGVKVSEETVDGVKITSMSNIDTTYSSAGLDLMPTVEALMGDDDEIDVWIVLDVRVDAEDGKEFPFGMKIRPGGVTALVSTEAAFKENYTDAETFKHQYGSISTTVHSGGVFTNEWQRIEIYKTFTAFDLNKDFWNKWNLCFDVMADYEDMGTLQIKNVGVYLFDEYESVLEGDDEEKEEVEYITPVTPSPVTIYRPYEFNKYTATFAEVKNQDGTNGVTDNVVPTNEINPDIPNDKGGSGIVIAIIIVVAVIAIGAVAVIIIKKSKKERKGDAEE